MTDVLHIYPQVFCANARSSPIQTTANFSPIISILRECQKFPDSDHSQFFAHHFHSARWPEVPRFRPQPILRPSFPFCAMARSSPIQTTTNSSPIVSILRECQKFPDSDHNQFFAHRFHSARMPEVHRFRPQPILRPSFPFLTPFSSNNSYYV